MSYEGVTRSKEQEANQETTNTTQVQDITSKFAKVNTLIGQQESQMNRLVEATKRHQARIENYLGSLAWAIFLETAIIVLGGYISLTILQKQIYAGYEVV